MHAIRLNRFLISLIAAFSLSHGDYAFSKPSETFESEIESEIRMTLSESAFKKIQSALNLEEPESVRIDTYFDVAEHGTFLRKRNAPNAKQRIQQKDKGITLQKSWLLQQSTYHSRHYKYSISRKVSAKKSLSLKSTTMNRVELSHKILETSITNEAISLKQKRFLENLWMPLRWPALAELDSAVENLPGKLVPSAVVTKERWKMNALTVGGEKFKIQLGQDSNTFGEKKKTYYELESELSDESPQKIEERVNSITAFLISHSVFAHETSDISDHDFFDDLESIYP